MLDASLLPESLQTSPIMPRIDGFMASDTVPCSSANRSCMPVKLMMVRPLPHRMSLEFADFHVLIYLIRNVRINIACYLSLTLTWDQEETTVRM